MTRRGVRGSRAMGWWRSPLPLVGRALILGLLLTLFTSLGSAFGATAQTTLYLHGGIGDHPSAPMSPSGPDFILLQNYDPSRDSDLGLMVKKGGSGVGESDDTKYQMWITAAGALDMAGSATLRFSSAMKDFGQGKGGEVAAYLLDCTAAGTGCTPIPGASGSVSRGEWSAGGGWVWSTINFGSIFHTVTSGRALAVKVIVTDGSDDDMWFAYNTTSFDAYLRITVDVPPPTTTTTTTTPTTTTTSPGTTTTTTSPGTTTTTTSPGTTTTTSTTTTTTAAPPGSTTTTSTSTTLPGQTTTTTTTLPGQATTTTTLPGQTTTTTAPGAITTTSTTVPPSTTTTTTSAPAQETTSTTVATVAGPPDPGDAGPPDQPPPGADAAFEEDGPFDVASIAADVPTVVAAAGAPVSGSFIEGLEIVLPPAVAEVLASPLLILELLFRAFADSSRSLLIPSLLLSLVAGWLLTHGPKVIPALAGWRRRREET